MSASRFILRTSVAAAMLSAIGLNSVFASPTSVSQASTSGPGWLAVERLIQTFDGTNATATSGQASNTAKPSKVSKSSKAASKLAIRSASTAPVGPSNLIDYQEMSLRCLGKKDWDSLTVSQRTQFVASLKSLVEQRYYPRWHKIFGNGKVTFQDEVSQGGDTIVRTKLLLGKKEELLSWRVAGPSSTPKIVSLSVSNNDLLERLKSRIKARQKKVGFDALLAWMKGRSNGDLSISSVNSPGPGAVLPIAAIRSPSLTAAAASAISD